MPALTIEQSDFLSDAEVASMIGITPATLGKWRTRREGPVWIEINRKHVRYHRSDVAMWFEARRKGTKDVDREAGRDVVVSLSGSRPGVPQNYRFGRRTLKSERG